MTDMIHPTTPGMDAKIKEVRLKEDVRNRFTYHPPKGDQVARYEKIRAAAHDLAMLLVDCCPASREQSLALTKLDEVVMHANSSIARNE